MTTSATVCAQELMQKEVRKCIESNCVCFFDTLFLQVDLI